MVDLFFVVFYCAGQSENPELGARPPEYKGTYIKTLIFGGVSLNKFEISWGACYIIFQIRGLVSYKFRPQKGVSYIIAVLYLDAMFGCDVCYD
jgi:hypothetical protein